MVWSVDMDDKILNIVSDFMDELIDNDNENEIDEESVEIDDNNGLFVAWFYFITELSNIPYYYSTILLSN